MRKIIIILSAAIGLSVSAHAQIKTAQIDINNIKAVLETMGHEIFRFDLRELLKDDYNVTLYIQESTEEESTNFSIGQNKKTFEGMTQQKKDEIIKDKGLKKHAKYIAQAEYFNIYLSKKNDSLSLVSVEVPGFGRMSQPLKLQPIVTPKDSVYFYGTRSFDINPQIKSGEKIPLVLFGSAWYDEKSKVCRMCGETRLNPDMSSTILKDIPHYYIIGIILNRIK